MTAEGFPKTGDGWTHVHVGGAEEATGKVTFENIFLAGGGYAFAAMEAKNATDEGDDAHYGYCGGWTATAHTDRIYVHVSGNGKSDLSNFRIKAKDKEIWAAREEGAGLLKNIDGSAADLTKKIGTASGDSDNSISLIIDLKAVGASLEKDDTLHLFNSSNEAGWTLDFDAATAYSESYPYAVALTSYNQNWN